MSLKNYDSTSFVIQGWGGNKGYQYNESGEKLGEFLFVSSRSNYRQVAEVELLHGGGAASGRGTKG